MWILSNSKKLVRAQAQLESLVLERSAQVQNLSQRLIEVQDDEKRKLARALHDSTGQTLVALKMSVSFLEEHCKRDPSTLSVVADVVALADQAMDEIRTMSYLLHPPLLDEVGFACAAEWFVEGFAKRSGIKVALDLAPLHERLPIRVETALFRVLQESLTNVHRHAGASNASVTFKQQPESVILEVRDFGRGIPADRLARLRESSAETGVGLPGMRERMQELNGKFEIESDAHGTSMRATVPLLAKARVARSRRRAQVPAPLPAARQQLSRAS